MLQRRKVLGIVPAAIGMTALKGHAQPANKPVRVIVPYPAGGAVDVSTRIMANALRGLYGDNIVIENRTGAGGRIAVDYVKNSDPDGTTILSAPNLVFTIYPHTHSKITYDLHRDFVPVAPFCSVGYSISVGPGVPDSVRTIADYGRWLRANPKAASFGTGAMGATQHFTGLMLGRALDIPLSPVGYRGGAPMAQDLMGGNVPMAVQAISDALELVRAGRVRVLAVTTPQRSPLLPNVPTMAELGFKDVIVTDVFGVFLPGRTPADIVQRLSGAVQAGVAKPEAREAFQKMTFEPQTVAQAPYAQSIERESAAWKRIVDASGFKAEE